MTKANLISQFSEYDSFDSKADAERAFNHLIHIITTEAKAGHEVALGQNFGTFKVATQAARSGTMNGTAYNTPAKNVVKFKPSAHLKSSVAGN